MIIYLNERKQNNVEVKIAGNDCLVRPASVTHENSVSILDRSLDTPAVQRAVQRARERAW